MQIDWTKAEESAGGNFKDYAPNGVFTVTVTSVDIHELQTGSVAQDFKFAEDEYKYPKATHWLSFKNDNWRFLHNRNLMMVLGASKADAQKAVEICESKGSREAIISAYQQTYDKLLKKQPKVEIEVWKEPGEKYSDVDFTDKSVRMNKPGDEKKEPPLKGAVELDTDDMGGIPF